MRRLEVKNKWRMGPRGAKHRAELGASVSRLKSSAASHSGTAALLETLVTPLGVAAVIIIVLHVLNVALGYPSWQLEHLLDLDGEANIASWFSGLLLAVSALVAYLCARKARLVAREQASLWWWVSVLLIFMSCDEVATLHERCTEVILHRVFGGQPLLRAANWIVVLGPFVIGCFAWLGMRLRQALRMSPVAARRMLLGVAIFLGGAMGVEFLLNGITFETAVWLVHAQIVIEESLEMAGVLCFLSGLLVHLQTLEAVTSDKGQVV